MAIDAFLVFTTQGGQAPLKGETRDKQFSAKGAVELLSYSFGMHNTVSIGSTSRGAGKAQFTDFTISKVVDSVSPNLVRYVGSGARIPQLDLYLRKAGGASGKGMVFLQYTFKLVYVANVDWSGGSGDESVKEDVSFAFGALQVTYLAQTASGQQGNTYTGSWNLVKNNSDISIPGVG